MSKVPHLFCFGLGYCAQHLAALTQGWKISGTQRSVVLPQDSIQMYEFEQLQELSEDVTHILVSIPPRGNTDLVIAKFANKISKLPHLCWVGYLSVTGVYGDHEGRWVDETTPTDPQAPLARPRIMAEHQWLNLWGNHQVPVHIFRLSGIYGPGRSEVEKALAKQSRIIEKPGHVFCRIHVADIAQVLYASMQNPTPGEVFNLADDLPASHKDIVNYTCQLLGMTPPPAESFETAEMSEMLRYFYSRCARVSNNKIKEVLGVAPHYPTYREGIKAIYEELKDVKPKA